MLLSRRAALLVIGLSACDGARGPVAPVPSAASSSPAASAASAASGPMASGRPRRRLLPRPPSRRTGLLRKGPPPLTGRAAWSRAMRRWPRRPASMSWRRAATRWTPPWRRRWRWRLSFPRPATSAAEVFSSPGWAERPTRSTSVRRRQPHRRTTCTGDPTASRPTSRDRAGGRWVCQVRSPVCGKRGTHSVRSERRGRSSSRRRSPSRITGSWSMHPS